MAVYVRELRALESRATTSSPMPALERLSRDLAAGQAKTLGLFVRDCVIGNCFPIDSRVQESLARFGLPADERLLVSCCLELDENPRHIARLFYDGSEGAFFGA